MTLTDLNNHPAVDNAEIEPSGNVWVNLNAGWETDSGSSSFSAEDIEEAFELLEDCWEA
jgi:hypothetical protein